MPTNSPERPFDDAYLLAYSKEHMFYEFDMFLWLAQVCGKEGAFGAPNNADAFRLSNVLIEGFVVHLRNVIHFLYAENPRKTDIVAADFCTTGKWESHRGAISATLEAARKRANKEIAHLTTDRLTGSPPEKSWDFSGLANEIQNVMRRFVKYVNAGRLSRRVSDLIR